MWSRTVGPCHSLGFLRGKESFLSLTRALFQINEQIKIKIQNPKNKTKPALDSQPRVHGAEARV